MNIGEDEESGKWSLDVMFGNALHIEKDMRQVIRDCGFQSEDASKPGYIAFGVNWGYTGAQSSSNLNPESIAAIVALLVLIVFTGYLVIYNVFQISVANDIRFYGLLKTIGMTGRSSSGSSGCRQSFYQALESRRDFFWDLESAWD